VHRRLVEKCSTFLFSLIRVIFFIDSCNFILCVICMVCIFLCLTADATSSWIKIHIKSDVGLLPCASSSSIVNHGSSCRMALRRKTHNVDCGSCAHFIASAPASALHCGRGHRAVTATKKRWERHVTAVSLARWTAIAYKTKFKY